MRATKFSLAMPCTSSTYYTFVRVCTVPVRTTVLLAKVRTLSSFKYAALSNVDGLAEATK